MDKSREYVREHIVELLGEGAWQYAFYNFDVPRLIEQSESMTELAEKIQDLIAADLNVANQLKTG